MIKSTTLVTFEADSPDEALKEILEQLEDKITLQKSTVGIISCNGEFIKGGVVAALQKGLPFPIVGEQSMTAASGGGGGGKYETDVFMLAILVMTSDTVTFHAGTTAQIMPDTDLNIVARSIKDITDGVTPSLLFAFVPFLAGRSGDSYIAALNNVIPGVPVFGSTAAGEELTFSELYIVGKDECGENLFSYIAVCGDINPHFLMTSVKYENKLSHSCVVTKSEDNVILEINNKPAAEFFYQHGLLKREDPNVSQLAMFPFTIKAGETDSDDLGVCRAFAAIIPETDAIIAAGAVPVGSTMSLFSIDKEAIVETAVTLVKQIDKIENANTVLIYSCMGRRMFLDMRLDEEVAAIAQEMRPNINFLATYSGGEFCPVHESGGGTTNYYHNYTLVTCIL
ncbi:hypothetical protein FACS1894120_3290 [Clostridia bacterium]|nr:hypothetical protein FACS1894120_3290 [Clostridia bacterium]